VDSWANLISFERNQGQGNGQVSFGSNIIYLQEVDLRSILIEIFKGVGEQWTLFFLVESHFRW